MYTLSIMGNLDGQSTVWQIVSDFIPRIGEELEIFHKEHAHKVVVTNVSYSIKYGEKTTDNNSITVNF